MFQPSFQWFLWDSPPSTVSHRLIPSHPPGVSAENHRGLYRLRSRDLIDQTEVDHRKAIGILWFNVILWDLTSGND